jgi:hypothetical protein
MMMTNEPWYEVVNANAQLAQGDIILDCPVLGWGSGLLEYETESEPEALEYLSEAYMVDAIVMTQGCDLENRKVDNVIICSHLSINQYRESWEQIMKTTTQTPTPKAWGKHCENIKNGYVWNLTMLNSSIVGQLKLDHRIVDFHDVYTLPLTFLETLLQNRGQPRLRLCPPYREHLSQAFARFFMRVGLPTGITKVW